jgi:plastocyanin
VINGRLGSVAALVALGCAAVACTSSSSSNAAIVIRTPITVVGKGGAVGAGTKPAGRDVEVIAIDYAFNLSDPGIKAGETIRFEMKNTGTQPHDFQVLSPDNKLVGVIDQTDPGKTGSATFTFDKPGTYRYFCDVSDHQSRGMKGTLTVAPS